MGVFEKVMDFGPVVKPLGITVKKEGGKLVETSVVVRFQTTRGVSKSRARAPTALNAPKKGPKF